MRRIYADIVESDHASGHLTLQVTRVTQDGQPVEFTAGLRYMTYELRGATLQCRVADHAFPTEVEPLIFMRIPDRFVSEEDR